MVTTGASGDFTRSVIITVSMGKRTNERERVILFTRYPEAGRTKTRLIPALGPSGAAELQRRMTEQGVGTLHEVAEQRQVSLEIRFEGGDVQDMAQWLGAELRYLPQGDGDLGRRLERAVAESFSAGMERVVVIGADCPALSADMVVRAFEMLRTNDLVLGPASDGGYYLIGFGKVIPEILFDISWGTARVLEQTLVCAKRLDLSVALLETLSDVDRPEDLENFHNHTGS